jgi:glycosyltransferase involved in cell wall biosynthesis
VSTEQPHLRPVAPEGRHRILVATGDVLGAQMAGPAIRAWQIASALHREHDVHLVSSVSCTLTGAPFPVSLVDETRFGELLAWCDVVIFQGHLMRLFPAMAHSDRVVVADVYDPFHLEVLEQMRDKPPAERHQIVVQSVDVLNEQLARADFVTCASRKQRDFWLGQLSGLGRINPLTYDADESLDSFVAVVPFGVSDDPPVRTRHAIRGVVPGIGPDDLVLLWGGGVYNWFDPLTLLRAVDRIKERVPSVRLFFLGLRHPNPHVEEMRMAVDTRKLSDELGLTGRHVFFNEDWVPYEDRQNYLLDADIGVSTHLDHIETAFSFRTRILDYLWAGLPIVATGGDSLAELIDAEGLGSTVPPSDVDALAEALERILTDHEFRRRCAEASAATADRFRWATSLEPLVRFCRAPRRAADATDRWTWPPPGPVQRPRYDPRRFVPAVIRRLRAGQHRVLLARIVARIRPSSDGRRNPTPSPDGPPSG